jgi:hypothetical protein
MSKSFTGYFTRYFTGYFTKYLINYLNNQCSLQSKLMIYVGTIGSSLHCSYALITSKNKIIKVDKKYKFVRNGFTEFMIIDHNGQHYNVNNSFWHWKWNSNEDWHKIQTLPNVEIKIKYYGWRVPLFGVFPNIVMSEIVNLKDYTDQKEKTTIFRSFL